MSLQHSVITPVALQSSTIIVPIAAGKQLPLAHVLFFQASDIYCVAHVGPCLHTYLRLRIISYIFLRIVIYHPSKFQAVTLTPWATGSISAQNMARHEITRHDSARPFRVRYFII